MLAIWQAAVEQFEEGRSFALATILDVKGSSPRHVGTRFLIRQDGTIVGTIGGGLFEAQVQEFAAAALRAGTSRHALFSFTGEGAESKEMICGGEAEVLVEFVNAENKAREEIFKQLLTIAQNRGSGYLLTNVAIPLGGQEVGGIDYLLMDGDGRYFGGFPHADSVVQALPQQRLLKPAQLLEPSGSEWPVFVELLKAHGTTYIFGAGHVGACVAHLAAYVQFNVVVLDDREEFASASKVPDAHQVIVVDSFHRAVSDLAIDEDSYLVIVTRGHAHDKTVLAQALRTNAGYIGMIGSRRKTKLIMEALLKEGFTREDLQRVHAPIGLPIGGETPQEIGISIIAEMIQIRHRKESLQRLGV
jgi:xanthine dehydrogenase accessory factor